MAFLQRQMNRGSVSTGYDIDNSLKVEVDNSEWIYRSSPSAGNRRTFTISLWLKRACLGHVPAGGDEYLAGQGSNARFHFAGDTLRFMFDGNSTELEASGKLRDTSAWYHIVLAVDTTQGTNTNRVKAYVNGESYPFNNSDWPSQNAQSDWMNTQNLYIGSRYPGDGDNDLAGYISEVVVLDGTQASPTDFGEYDEDSGIWKPIDVSDLTFGSEGFYYKFDDASDLGKDSSGNGNDATLNNIAAANQATDTPTNNFCTWNPLWTFSKPRTISEGGTNADGSSSWGGVKGTIGVTNGKWYWENKASGTDTIIGWQTDNCVAESNEESMHNVKDTIGFYTGYDYVYIRDETSGRNDTSTTGSNVSGQIIGMALDLDSSPQTATFYRNGSAVSSAINIDGLTGKTLFPFMSQYNYNAESNFGGYTSFSISSAASDANGYGTFEYAPPSGYYAICGKNLAEFGGSA